jgi:hypothetical protein
MGHYFKSDFIGHFRGNILQGRIKDQDHNHSAPDTDHMRMGKGVVAVVPVASIGKGYF